MGDNLALVGSSCPSPLALFWLRADFARPFFQPTSLFSHSEKYSDDELCFLVPMRKIFPTLLFWSSFSSYHHSLQLKTFNELTTNYDDNSRTTSRKLGKFTTRSRSCL